MDTLLFWLTMVSGAFAAFFAIAPNISPIWERSEDGKGRPTRWGQVSIAVAVVIWLMSIVAAQMQKSEADTERAAADAKAQAQTDSVTRRLEGVLSQARSLRDDNERLRSLQLTSLTQVDSVLAAAAGVTARQERALRALEISLDLSTAISDTLHTGLVLSRQIADSLRRSEEAATERARQTLRVVEQSRNPLLYIRAPIHLLIPRETREQQQLVNRLYSARRPGRRSSEYPYFGNRIAPVHVSGRWVTVEDGRPHAVILPSGITLDFWRGDPECTRSQEYLLQAKKMLEYDSAGVIFGSGAAFNWETTDFELDTDKNLSVDDLRDTCVSFGFYGYPVGEGDPVWSTAKVGILRFTFPQGRTASITFRPDPAGGPLGPVVSWVGRLKLDN